LLFAKSPGANTAGALFLRIIPAPFLLRHTQWRGILAWSRAYGWRVIANGAFCV